MNKKSIKKTFERINTLANQVQKFKSRRDKLAEQLATADARIADLELEWNDVQKEISADVFGSLLPGGVTMTSADQGVLRTQESGSTKAAKKKRRKRRKASPKVQTKMKKQSKKPASRAEIRALAVKRDQAVFEVIKRFGKADFYEILSAGTVEGNNEQIKTSLKRLKEQKLIKPMGVGRAVQYNVIGKKGKK